MTYDLSKEPASLSKQFRDYYESNCEEPDEHYQPELYSLFNGVSQLIGLHGRSRRDHFIPQYRRFHLANTVYMAKNGSDNGMNKTPKKDSTDNSTGCDNMEKVYRNFDSDKALDLSRALREANVEKINTVIMLYDDVLKTIGNLIPRGDKKLFQSFRVSLLISGISLVNGLEGYCEAHTLRVIATSFKTYADTNIKIFKPVKIDVKAKWPAEV